MTESELTNEQEETLYCYLQDVDEDEQYAYKKGWIDCLEEYKYQEFIEKELIDKACGFLSRAIDEWNGQERHRTFYLDKEGCLKNFKKAMEE